MRAASISLDPGQFLFARLEGLVTTLSVREMADETCNHHQFVFTLSAILPMLFACAQLHGFLLLMIMLQQQQLHATHRALFFDFNRAAAKLRRLNKRRKNRRVWVRPGRTEQWWINLWTGVLEEQEWHSNLRMDRASFLELVENVRPLLEPDPRNFRADVMSVEKKVAMTLYYLKDQGSYRMTCNTFGVSLPCLSRTVKAVCASINAVLGPEYLRLPKDVNEMKGMIGCFENRFGFPQAFGCLDGTHIPIKQPTENSHDYFCYKMKFSLNVQALCDYRGVFLDVEIMWPGSVHDARVYANSQLNKHFVEKTLPMTYRSLLPGTDRIPPLILGDPAYPLLPNVMKEYGEEAYNEKAVYNQVLRGTRNQIECAYGRLKARWQILNRAMDIKLEDVPVVIHTCFILHNFCELKGCQLNEEYVERQMQLNISDRCCSHHNQPDRLYTYNTATGVYYRQIITDFLKEHM